MSEGKKYIEIDLAKLSENYKHIEEKLIDKRTKIMAVVKANAYGHGAKRISLHLNSIGCENFAVSSVDEGVELRSVGATGEILVLGNTTIDDIATLLRCNLTASIINLKQALQFSEYMDRSGSHSIKIKCHLKIDTGMSRFGLYCHASSDLMEVKDICKQIYQLPYLDMRGIYTHFIKSEERNRITIQQFHLFSKIVELLSEDGIYVGLRHTCNSSAVFNYPEMQMDMVRCGIALYGYVNSIINASLSPVMTVYAYVVDIRNAKKGDYVGYGKYYKLQKDTIIATIDIGYADGYPRNASGIDFVLIGENKYKVVGSVCMDAMMILVENNDENIEIGTRVLIFGKSKPVSILSTIVNTIPYEILCRIKRMEYKYII
jgi:alanine racemase